MIDFEKKSGRWVVSFSCQRIPVPVIGILELELSDGTSYVTSSQPRTGICGIHQQQGRHRESHPSWLGLNVCLPAVSSLKLGVVPSPVVLRCWASRGGSTAAKVGLISSVIWPHEIATLGEPFGFESLLEPFVSRFPSIPVVRAISPRPTQTLGRWWKRKVRHQWS